MKITNCMKIGDISKKNWRILLYEWIFYRWMKRERKKKGYNYRFLLCMILILLYRFFYSSDHFTQNFFITDLLLLTTLSLSWFTSDYKCLKVCNIITAPQCERLRTRNAAQEIITINRHCYSKYRFNAVVFGTRSGTGVFLLPSRKNIILFLI